MAPRNVNEEVEARSTLAQRIADRVTDLVGSWWFITFQLAFYAGYILWNSLPWLPHFDGWPFIFLNLIVGFEAAFAGPFVMMTQNRQEHRDRLAAEVDHQVNVKAEMEDRRIIDLLIEIKQHIEDQQDLTRWSLPALMYGKEKRDEQTPES